MARNTDFQVLQKDVEQYTEKLTVAKLLHINFNKCSGGSQTKILQSQSEFKDLTNGIDTFLEYLQTHSLPGTATFALLENHVGKYT